MSTIAIRAAEAPARTRKSNYPPVFAARVEGRHKHPLGDLFGLRNFGVNLTRLAPGAATALHHRHSKQDEFVYVLQGRPTLFSGDAQLELEPGMCAGFPAAGEAHHLENLTDEEVVILEVGDRTPGDEGSYPNDDLVAVLGPEGWRFARKSGEPY